MSIYQKLNEINTTLDLLTVRVGNTENGTFTTVTASNFSASAGLANLTTITASNFSASAGLVNLTTITASNFSASAGLAFLTRLTASNFSASAGLVNLTTVTASNFSASTGFANLTRLTASNFSASAGLANLTTITASNIKVNNEITTLDLTATNNTTTENLTVNNVLNVGPLNYDPMNDQFDFDNTTIGLINGAGVYGDAQSYVYVGAVTSSTVVSSSLGNFVTLTGSNAYFSSDVTVADDFTAYGDINLGTAVVLFTTTYVNIGSENSINKFDGRTEISGNFVLKNEASPPTVINGALANITGSLYFGSGSVWRKVTLT
jgi:hypothetical protein